MSTTASASQLSVEPVSLRTARWDGRVLLVCTVAVQLICPWLAGEAWAMSMRRAPFHGGEPFAWEHPVWRTLAGSPSMPGTNDGPGISARFWSPSGITVDAGGTIFVADSENRVIRRISPAGAVSTIAGKLGQAGWQDGLATNALFSWPTVLALDASGNLYIADDCTVRRLNPEGEITTIAGLPSVRGYLDGWGTNAMFQAINGLAVASDGTVYVADSGNYVVRKISVAGITSTVAGQVGVTGYRNGVGTDALFGFLGGLALDSGGDLLVCESGYGGDLGPNHLIRRISPAGLVTTWVGQPGRSGYRDDDGTNAWFAGPRGLAIDSQDNLFVTETENRCVRKVSPGGRVSTLGGDPWISGHRDGLGPFATFVSPQAVAADPFGHLLVVDSSDNTVRYGSVEAESQPRILAQPRSQAVQEGAKVAFSVVAQSAAPLTYQWLLYGELIPGGTNSSLIVEQATPETVGDYSVAVSDGVGYVLSFPATLQMAKPVRVSASPLENWRPLASLALREIHGLAFGQGCYVVVGGGVADPYPADYLRGAVVTSADGEHWVKHLPISSESLNSVAFGNERFVVVGNNGTIFTSTNGVAWNGETLSGEARPNLRGVVFDQGLFVAVSSDANGSIWTTSDGVDWTRRWAGFGASFMAIWAGEGRFITVGNTILVSTNGLDWEPASVPTNYLGQEILLEHVAGSNGTLLAAQHWGGVLAASATGQEWRDVTPTNGLVLGGVVSGRGRFVAVDSNSGGTCVSTDGTVWTAPAVITYGGRTWGAPHVRFANGVFLASSDYGLLATTAEGINWSVQRQQQAIPFNPVKIIEVGERYFAAGENIVAASTNGSDWEPLFPPSTANSLAFGQGNLVVVGSTDQIASSQDGGLTWIDRSPHLNYGTLTPDLVQITYGGGVFVAVGRLYTGSWPQVSRGHILSSSNLVHWVATEFPPTNSISDVAFGGGLFVALLNMESGGTQILTSTNGFSWTTARTLPADNLHHASYGKGRFVLTSGSQGEVISSPDGISWYRHPVPGAYNCNGVVFGNELFLAMSNAEFWSSPDGITWTPCAAPGNYQQALAVGEGRFLVFDYDPSILYQSGPLERLTNPQRLPNLDLEWTVTGARHIDYRIEFSEDLLNWQTLTRVTNATATSSFIDPAATTPPKRFYRVVSE